MLLALLHASSTTDIHCENLIANGEHPVVIDLETMLSSREPTLVRQGDLTEPLDYGVLATGLLPRWQTAPDGHRFDLSALGADQTQDPGVRGLVWHSINTDQMRLESETGGSVSGSHRPRLGGAGPSVRDHLPALITGFRQAWACLHANRGAIAADDSWRDLIQELELRTLLRGTTTYTRIQLRLLHPEFLEDGIDRSIEIDWFARPLSGPHLPSPDRVRVYESERTAMEKLDVPRFVTSMWRDVTDDGDPDLQLLCAPRNVNVLLRRLADMTDDECANQVALITRSIASRFPNRRERSGALGRSIRRS